MREPVAVPFDPHPSSPESFLPPQPLPGIRFLPPWVPRLGGCRPVLTSHRVLPDPVDQCGGGGLCCVALYRAESRVLLCRTIL